jgi:hypothetical protein
VAETVKRNYSKSYTGVKHIMMMEETTVVETVKGTV